MLPAPTAPSEGSAGVRNLVKTRRPRPALDPGSPAQASHPTEPLPLSRSPTDLLDCAARRFAGLSTVPARHSATEVPRSQNRPVFRGPSWVALSRVPLRSPTIRRPPGTAARLRKTTLPAPLPGWPGQNPKALPNPAGGDRTFGHLPLPLAVSGSWRGRDRRPDHPCTMHLPSESRKRKMRG